MRNKKNILIIFLVVWATSATFVAVSNSPYKSTVFSYFSEPAESLPIEVKKEHEFINSFFEDYFIVSMDTKGSQINRIEANSDDSLHDYLVDERKRTVGRLKKSNGSLNYELLNLSFIPETDLYLALVKTKGEVNNVKTNNLISLEIIIGRDRKSLYIKGWKEKIIEIIPTKLQGKNILITSNGFSTLTLPCAYEKISSDKNNVVVDSKINKGKSQVLFKTDDTFNGKTTFRISCGRRSFKVTLSFSENELTLHKALSLNDGILKKKILTKEEKLKKILKEQLGLDAN